MAKAKNVIPDGYHSITPQLVLDNAAQTIDWYKRALGAEEVSRSVAPDGKIMHAELKIGNSRFMVNDPIGGAKGPNAYGGSPASLWLYVDDSDAVYKRATGAGARIAMPLENQFWGDRAGSVVDPAGYVWWIATHKEDLTHDEIQRRAAEFFKQQPQHA